MAQNFLSCDREQAMLLPPSVSDWLPRGHLARFVIEVVETLDLSGIVAAYRVDGSGRPAHDPAMMVALVFYSYAVGVRSSRAIERRCVEDVPSRVIAANRTPDHVTIARFRRRHARALSGLFDEVLALCARSGLVAAGTIAIDGTKLSANASLDSNRSYRAIAEELLADAERIDREEDERFGDRRGDELPPELADPQTRRERLAEAKRQLDAERQAAQTAYEQTLARRAEREQKTGRRLGGRKPKPPEQLASKAPSERRNVTDPDSRIVRDRGALIQGYNAQIAVGAGRVILATEVTSSPNDSGQLAPMTSRALQALQRLEGHQPPATVLADGSYWNREMIGQLTGQGIEVLIPTSGPATGPGQRRSAKQGLEAQRIERLLATPAGQARYRQRAVMAEPVFAEIKHTRQITRFLRRGLQAVRDEFALIATTHNIRRLYFAGLQAA